MAEMSPWLEIYFQRTNEFEMLKSESKRKMTSKVGQIAASATRLVNNIFQQLRPALLPLGRLLATQATPPPPRTPIPFPRAAPPGLPSGPPFKAHNPPGRGGSTAHTADDKPRPQGAAGSMATEGRRGGCDHGPGCGVWSSANL